MADRANGVLLDSSVIIAHWHRKLDLAQQVAPTEPLFLPLTALGELYKGALKSALPDKNLALIDELLKRTAVLNHDMATAWRYAEVSAALERQGLLIPEGDLWIAAVALEYDLPLATRDAHFARVPGLTVLDWR